MTVARLASGGLALHSPVQLDDALKAEVDALGRVEALIAPCLFHHMFLEPWCEAYPDARRWLVAGLENKRPGLRGGELLETAGPELPGGGLRRFKVEGVPACKRGVLSRGVGDRADGSAVFPARVEGLMGLTRGWLAETRLLAAVSRHDP